MQERYLPARDERFAVIVRTIRDTQDPVDHLVDLGCGTGSLTARLLDAFPGAQVTGIDFDATLLPLARARLAIYRDRVRVVEADLRHPSWTDSRGLPASAVVSATALHWLNERQLQRLYGETSSILAPGGIFLNADHVGSDSASVQDSWERQRKEFQSANRSTTADDWEGFWEAYLGALGEGPRRARERAIGKWQGTEQGFPLQWHFDRLREQGFSHVDCFWRLNCDAIYGGMKATMIENS
jgi:SAM-dependent methyltransferase